MKKKKIVRYTSIVFLAISSLFSCDIIKKEQVYEQGSTPIPINPADSAKPDRKVFLEIFTGYKCTNCPAQTKEGLEGLAASKLSEKTVIMKIHQGFFAKPSGSKFKLDFQTQVGNTLGTKFAILGYPTGIVDRKQFNSSYSVSPSDWRSKVGLVPTKADVDIKISKVYDATGRNLKISIVSSLYSNTINKLNASAYIVEDSISYWQVDDGVDIPNFIHRHVLRDAFSSANGEDLFAANATKGIKASKEFTPYTLKPEWNDKHCEIIVIITDAVTGEVLQVEEAKVIE